MLPSTADEGEVIRRKLYADIIASKVRRLPSLYSLSIVLKLLANAQVACLWHFTYSVQMKLGKCACITSGSSWIQFSSIDRLATMLILLCRVQGVVGVIIEAPYYGSRRPAAQKQWFLRQLHHSFTQVFTIGYEAACLLHWAQHTWHLPLAITGVSAGAAMAGLAAKFFNGPVAVVAYMGCAGPAEPFTQGTFWFQAMPILAVSTLDGLRSILELQH